MNFKVPSIASAVVFVLIFLINLIVGNSFGINLLRSFISAAVTFGLFFAMMFVFKSVLGVSAEDLQDESDSSGDDGIGQNFDATVGDDESGSDIQSGNDDYSAGESSDSGESAEISDSGGEYSDGGDDFLPSEEHSYEEEGFADAGTSDSGGNVDGDTIREKLGYDATAEDLAKAIRTIIPRDDN